MPIERPRGDAGHPRVTEGGVEDANLNRCAIPRSELRDRRELWNKRRRGEGADR
jgi:hypothetical protein